MRSVSPRLDGRRQLAVLALAITVAAAWLAGVGVAAAATFSSAQGAGLQCDEVFTDPDGLGDADDRAQVERAVEPLATEHGLFVRVRLIATAGPDGLDVWAEDALASCAAWQGTNGARTNLLLLAVAFEDRNVGSYFGAEAAGILESTQMAAHQAMGAKLSDDLGDGFVAGLARYAEVFPTSSSSGSSSVVPWALGGAAVVGTGVAGGLALRRRGRRRAVQDSAEEARTAAMSAYYDLEERWEAVAAGVTVMTQATHADDGIAATVAREADEAERALAAVRDALLALPDPTTLVDPEEAQAAVRAWQAQVERVAQASIEVDEVDDAVTQLQQAKEHAPARIEDAAAAAGRAQEAVTNVAQTFKAATAQGWAAEATSAVEAARQALADGRFGDAVAATVVATERATDAETRAKEIPALATSLPRDASALAADSERAADAARAADGDVRALRDRWRRTVWDDLSDASPKAGELAAEAGRLAAGVAAAAESQDWEQALQRLDEGREREQEAVALAARPAERHAEAEANLSMATERHEAARRQLAEASALFATTTADVSPQRSAVRAAERQLEKGAELLTGKPDPIRAATVADEAIAALQTAVTAGQRVIDAFERATDEAESLLRQAGPKLREAERADPRTAAFRRDVNRAEDLLDEARELVATEPEAAADRARRGIDLANRVIRDKRRDRDRDRDEWRRQQLPPTRTTRSSSTRMPRGGTVLGGSPSRPAPRTSSPRRSGGFSGGGSSRTSGFGGGGSSKF